MTAPKRDWGGFAAATLPDPPDPIPPVACPNDGTPLEVNARGERNCPWGDFSWPC